MVDQRFKRVGTLYSYSGGKTVKLHIFTDVLTKMILCYYISNLNTPLQVKM